MGASPIPKEEFIVGSQICELTPTAMTYADDSHFRIFYFASDIAENCFELFTKIRYKYIYRKIVYHLNTIVSVIDDADLIYTSKCLVVTAEGAVINKNLFEEVNGI